MTNSQPAAAEKPLTEEAPERFVIGHVRWNVELTEAEHWVEEGLHVVRATVFDLTAIADDFRSAVTQFVEEAHDLCFKLRDLVERDEATKAERDLFIVLAEPILAVYERDREQEERERNRYISVSFPRLRRRGHHYRGDWRPGSSHAKPAQPSAV